MLKNKGEILNDITGLVSSSIEQIFRTNPDFLQYCDSFVDDTIQKEASEAMNSYTFKGSDSPYAFSLVWNFPDMDLDGFTTIKQISQWDECLAEAAQQIFKNLMRQELTERIEKFKQSVKDLVNYVSEKDIGEYYKIPEYELISKWDITVVLKTSPIFNVKSSSVQDDFTIYSQWQIGNRNAITLPLPVEDEIFIFVFYQIVNLKNRDQVFQSEVNKALKQSRKISCFNLILSVWFRVVYLC